MIRKSEKLIITFHTTAAAMAMEAACKAESAPGRLIPVPGSISADCGLAWCADLFQEETLLSLMARSHIPHQEIHRCLV